MSEDAKGDIRDQQAPSELERAKANAAKEITQLLNEKLFGGEQHPCRLGAYIGETAIERIVAQFPDKNEDEIIEMLEGLPGMNTVSMSAKGGNCYRVVLRGDEIESDLARVVTKEFVRANLLARTADYKYTGVRNTANFSRQMPGGFPNYTEWMQVYARIMDPNLATNAVTGASFDKEEVVQAFGQYGIIAEYGYVDQPRSEQQKDNKGMKELLEADSDLFADFMLAYAMQDNGVRNGKLPFADKWRGMVIEPQNNFFVLSEEGIPYRKGNKVEDIRLIKEKLEKLTGGSEIKTYGELSTELQMAKAEKVQLEAKNETLSATTLQLIGEKGALADALEIEKTAKATATRELTTAQAATLRAEAKAEAVEERLQRVLAILGREVGFLAKDTRNKEVEALINSPLVVAPPKANR